MSASSFKNVVMTDKTAFATRDCFILSRHPVIVNHPKPGSNQFKQKIQAEWVQGIVRNTTVLFWVIPAPK
jgi:hypothetical protein